MKKYIVVIFIAIGWISIDFCQAQDKAPAIPQNSATLVQDVSGAMSFTNRQLERAMVNYLRALQHPNDGVVESAMINLIKLKFHFPDLDYGKIIEQLNYLELEGRNQSMRFLAFFTVRYLQDASDLSSLFDGTHEFNLNTAYLDKLVQK